MISKLDKAIAKSISRYTLWAEDSIENAYDILGSWDKTLIACENASVLALDLKTMALTLADKKRRFWRRYEMGDDGRVGTYKP